MGDECRQEDKIVRSVVLAKATSPKKNRVKHTRAIEKDRAGEPLPVAEPIHQGRLGGERIGFKYPKIGKGRLGEILEGGGA